MFCSWKSSDGLSREDVGIVFLVVFFIFYFGDDVSYFLKDSLKLGKFLQSIDKT